MSLTRAQMRYMNPYDLHKALINDYVLKNPGDSTKLLQRDTSKDRTDRDVLRANHKFLWDDDTAPDTWELQFAKKYYDKLFKEYCIADLSRYKENKIALRWRIEREVVVGKGQFICGNKKCDSEDNLRTWEVNFGYNEQGERKNALVKIRLCPECSKKLNYHSKKREVKRIDRKPRKKPRKHAKSPEIREEVGESSKSPPEETVNTDESPWEQHKPIETKSRDEEMEDYLQDLLL